ncbi:hypothetical protein OJ996_17555 [Luteolibacter sp. GHJ8]|uniref:FG-GAP repeat protein n=1 Tax=Luteolibacter rhizosphaerae TaxID=2989719 RepID=A0ABT3G867_9BACT|nr:hypothetical protein [Luteolibacter rhizosphaerae]MCW1915395.1 hypothetical protein [Luteolibacter rhizosphaerae]
MKTLLSLFAGSLGIVLANEATPIVPEGVAPSDWAGIRAAYEAARHAPKPLESGRMVARNPGQQWSTEFDGRGFTITPDHGAWSWGLELTRYGELELPPEVSPLRSDGKRIICQRDENLSEWFINDSRGLEQGWDIKKRPERTNLSEPLRLQLASRGNVHPQVSARGDSVFFQDGEGESALTYGGLKAWDADGKKLEVSFEQTGGREIHILVDDLSARYPITIDPVARQAYLKASNTGPGDSFGSAVAISGDTVVVGAPDEGSGATGVNGDQANGDAPESGAAYVFTRSSSGWTQQAYLKASNTGPEDEFGSAVAISGDTIVIGACREDSNASGVNGDQSNSSFSDAGAAYVFHREGSTWSQQAYLKAGASGAINYFGRSVGISGDTVVVGAPQRQYAYVFTRTGAEWTQQAALQASNPDPGDEFGYSVAISGDTVAVGAWHERNPGNTAVNAGAVYVFTRGGTTWNQQAYLSRGYQHQLFGCAVALSGDTLVVGAMAEDQNNTVAGSASIYVRSGTTWAPQGAALQADIPTGADAFGASVAISGDAVVVGTLRTGTAHLFTRSGGTWTRQPKLATSYPGESDAFASAVAISGDTVVIGARDESSNATGVNGDPENNSSGGSGAAYIINLNPPPPSIAAVTGGINLQSGSMMSLGPIHLGGAIEIAFNLLNNGGSPLILTGEPKAYMTSGSDFTVTAQPASPLAGSGGSSSFKVRFSPTGPGPKSAYLYIPTNRVDESLFVLSLTGTGVAFAPDSDGDGLSDAWEINMAALGFNWQVNQPGLVKTYLNNTAAAGLMKVQALGVEKTSVARDAANGRVKLTTRWKKSMNLVDFLEFPAPVGSSVSVNPAGDIEFEFSYPDDATLIRIEPD